MVSFDAIRRNIESINYGCNLGTTLLLVPGLSLMVRTIKETHLEQQIVETYAPSGTFEYGHSRSVFNDKRLVVDMRDIRNAHALSGAIQLITILAILYFFGSTLVYHPIAHGLLGCGGMSAHYETFSSLSARPCVRDDGGRLSVGYSA